MFGQRRQQRLVLVTKKSGTKPMLAQCCSDYTVTMLGQGIKAHTVTACVLSGLAHLKVQILRP